MLNYSFRNRGITLVEMLIALVISSAILVGIASFYVFVTHNSKRSLEVMRLDQGLYMAMEVMVRDIRNAGYWSNAQTDLDTGTMTNPFMQTETNIQIANSNSCILFSYDKNKDGVLPDLGTTSDERFGFRLYKNIIQSRVSSNEFSCGNNTGWVDLTNPNIINVSNLSFVESTASVDLGGGDKLNKRNVTISLTANLVADSTITRTLSRQITVRNSKYVAST